MNLKSIHSVYFVGIGGIGMSAIARWFNANDYFVAGYDKTSTPLTIILEKEGMHIHYEDAVENIRPIIRNEKEHVLIVYTPAIPKGHKELNYFLDEGFEVMKRSEVLGIISDDLFTLAVAGTHGKTTTSSILTHLLAHNNKNCSAFLGGITKNYNSNLILSGKTDKNTNVVVEADEFDRSFLTLSPNIAIITSADADHLDIYGDKESLEESFKDFIGKIEPGGTLIANTKLPETLINCRNDIQIKRYSLEQGNIFVDNIRTVDGNSLFDIKGDALEINDLILSVPGFHNIENTIAASLAASLIGLTAAEIKSGIESYTGVKRRFEYVIKNDNCIYIDDYAHHPEEINALIKSVRHLYPEKRVTAIFQPHLFTRTRDFADGFAESLSKMDELILMDIYPARELPIAGVDSSMLLDKISNPQKELCSKEDLLASVKAKNPELLLTIGAGDIDQFVEPLKELLS